MFARQHSRHQNQRFHVNLAQPPRRGRLPFRVSVVHRHKKHRFYVEPFTPSHQHVLPVQLVIERRHTRRRSAATAVTLARRRQVRRWALFLSLAGALLIAVVGGLSFSPLAHSLMKTSSPSLSSATGGSDAGGRQAAQNLSTQPFTSLQPHLAANSAQPPAVQAAAAFLFDPDRGWIFYQKNADEQRSIASLTKVMTLLVAVDSSNLDQPITIGPDAAALVNSGNSYIGVSAGEQLTLRDLLYGIMVGSGNDAAVAIADGVGGSEASFVTLMNSHARRLGLTHTFFVTPDGVADGNRSTARDMAILTAVALEQPGVEQITATWHITIPKTATHKAYDLLSSNDLLPGGLSPYPGADGVKTGYTGDAQYCLAFSARRQGHLIVGVVLGDPSSQARLNDAHALLDWGFAQE